jgi:hypothetical protein
MLLDPLHPAIVHFPVVLAILVPVAAIVALVLVERGAVSVAVGWGAVVGLTLLLTGSSWLALETGEQQEERVEKAVGEGPLDAHAARGQQFLAFAGLTLCLSAFGLARGRLGRGARGVSAVAALAMIPLGFRVGHSGGELVYRHGAAAVYSPAGGGETAAVGRPDADDDDH